MPFPDIAPEIFSIELFGLTLALRWYAVAYIAGLLLGWALVRRLMARPMAWPGGVAPLSKTDVDDIMKWFHSHKDNSLDGLVCGIMGLMGRLTGS